MAPRRMAGAIAIIPARGGSKRIPRKNIRPMLGVPLIARTINVLRKMDVFERIVVSTDDSEIAELASRAGAEMPFVRPSELSDDFSGTLPVLKHAVDQLELSDDTAVCCVYPAAIFVTREMLSSTHDLLVRHPTDFVLPVVRYSPPIQRNLVLGTDGACQLSQPDQATIRTQDLEPRFHDAGQFYWGFARTWRSARSVLGWRLRAIEVPSRVVQDIDTEDDWVAAELKLQRIHLAAEADTGRS